MAWQHGASAYANGTCKCDICREANRERHRDYMNRCRWNSRVTSHGSVGYQQGCRCEVCTAYNTERSRLRREKERSDG